jgi:hypothetical protein
MLLLPHHTAQGGKQPEIKGCRQAALHGAGRVLQRTASPRWAITVQLELCGSGCTDGSWQLEQQPAVHAVSACPHPAARKAGPPLTSASRASLTLSDSASFALAFSKATRRGDTRSSRMISSPALTCRSTREVVSTTAVAYGLFRTRKAYQEIDGAERAA